MTRPATLGGHAAPKAQSGTGSVEADFIEAYQDARTRQWLGRVKLEGGRVLEGVRFIYPGSRASVGSRGSLPAKGERGIVLYPASQRQVKYAYWLGSIDHYTFGPDVSHPDEEQMLHASGAGLKTERGGAQIYRFANGDHLFRGVPDAGEDDSHFYQRPRDGAGEARRVAQNSSDPRKISQWKYRARNGRFFGATLIYLRVHLGALAVNVAGKRWQARYTDPRINHFVQAAPGEGSLYTYVQGAIHAWVRVIAGGTATLFSESPGGAAKLELDGGASTATLHADKHIGLLAADITAVCQSASFAGHEPVAMERETMINLQALAAAIEACCGIKVPLIDIGSGVLKSVKGAGSNPGRASAAPPSAFEVDA